MGAKFTRRRFLTAVGAGAMCLTLTNTMGFEPRERTPKVRALHTPFVQTSYPYVAVRAKHRSGRALGVSRPVKPESRTVFFN